MTDNQSNPVVNFPPNNLINNHHIFPPFPPDPPMGSITVGHIGGGGSPSGGWSPGGGWLPASSWDYSWHYYGSQSYPTTWWHPIIRW
ncbi:hypothetical protein [Bacillus massiliigorillae]|uniref:hypothetical protein n=1 Tax=Bacillus massiliigorillae TaxID=1243664 RepID=UPI0003A8967D|nr:hypothetical protein [Bacillus massiliigorillae]